MNSSRGRFNGPLCFWLRNYCHPYKVRIGDRIAQMVIKPYMKVEWRNGDKTNFDQTKTNEGGFGSMGRYFNF